MCGRPSRLRRERQDRSPDVVALAARPYGDGTTINGSVVAIDDDRGGDLVTNIPFRWVIARLSDKSSLVGDKSVPPEYVTFRLQLGNRRLHAVCVCWDGGMESGTWLVEGGGDDDMIVLRVKDGSAA